MMQQPIRESEFLNAKSSVYFLGRWENAETWCVVRRSHTEGGQTISTKTEADAKALWDRCVNGQRCVECDAPTAADENYGTPTEKAARIEASVCFACNFWRELVGKTGPTVAVIDGYRYSISPDQPKGYRGFVGHGGAEFVILFHGGREVVTHNLWANGRVPEHFAERIPNNADFTKVAGNAGYIGHGSAVGAKAQP